MTPGSRGPSVNGIRKFAVPVLLLLPVGWILYLMWGIYAYSSTADPLPADAAVVLGAEVWDGRPSPVFEQRIRHAVSLYDSGQVGAIIFTGGVGEGDLLAESEVARRYAVDRGVPEESVFCEVVSTTTYENLREAARIVEEQRMGRVLVVSDPLHMKRAVTIAHDLGMDAHPSPTPTTRFTGTRTRAWFLLHETFFYATYLLRGYR